MDDKEKIKLLEKQIELLEKINELQRTIEMQRITTTPVIYPTIPTYPATPVYPWYDRTTCGGGCGTVSIPTVWVDKGSKVTSSTVTSAWIMKDGKCYDQQGNEISWTQ